MNGVGSPDTTTWIIIATAVIWAAWDVYIWLNGGETISIKMNRWGQHVMAIVFILGFLAGHFFF